MLRFLPSSQNLRIYLHPYFALPYFALPKPNFTRGLCKEPHGGPVVNLGSIPGGGTNISKATQTQKGGGGVVYKFSLHCKSHSQLYKTE